MSRVCGPRSTAAGRRSRSAALALGLAAANWVAVPSARRRSSPRVAAGRGGVPPAGRGCGSRSRRSPSARLGLWWGGAPAARARPQLPRVADRRRRPARRSSSRAPPSRVAVRGARRWPRCAASTASRCASGCCSSSRPGARLRRAPCSSSGRARSPREGPRPASTSEAGSSGGGSTSSSTRAAPGVSSAGGAGSVAWATGCARRSAMPSRSERRASAGRSSIGVVLGADEGIDPELRDAFKASGLYHLLAVSGQNIVLIGFGVLGLAYVRRARPGGRAHRSRSPRSSPTRSRSAGSRPSCARPSRAASPRSRGCSRGRATAGTRWRWGRVVLLAWTPRSLLEPGFQLSFAAVAAIFVTMPRLRRLARGLSGACAASSRSSASRPPAAS